MMMLLSEPYLVVCTLIGFASGLESWLGGRRLAIGTHGIAALFGFYGVGATDLVGVGQTGLSLNILYALGALFLACAWVAESDSLKTEEDPRERGDAANHVIAFVVGLACALQCMTLVVLACAELLALFLRRAQEGKQPAAPFTGARMRRQRVG